MTPAEAEALVPLAAELVGTVRDFGPDAVAAVLARVPANRHDALAVVLAAMVDPDQSPSNLLAWTIAGPVQSRDATPAHLTVKNVKSKAAGRWSERRAEIARLTALGLSSAQIAYQLGITPRAVTRHRSIIRAAVAS
jgi:DNA-binding NarL/FixJ family response regulator